VAKNISENNNKKIIIKEKGHTIAEKTLARKLIMEKHEYYQNT